MGFRCGIGARDQQRDLKSPRPAAIMPLRDIIEFRYTSIQTAFEGSRRVSTGSAVVIEIQA